MRIDFEELSNNRSILRKDNGDTIKLDPDDTNLALTVINQGEKSWNEGIPQKVGYTSKEEWVSELLEGFFIL